MATSQKHRLAILDDYFDIATSKFARPAQAVDVESFPKTLNARDPDGREELISRLEPFTIISTMRERTAFPSEVLSALPNLKLLITTGTRNAAIDLEACRRQGIVVCGATGAGASGTSKPKITSLESTMEHTWALILALARNISQDDSTVRNGGWQTSPAIGLKGKTIGILGLGKLGTMAARIAKLAFGMHVLAWSSSLTQDQADERAKQAGLSLGDISVVSSKHQLLRHSDVLSVHYVLSDRSRDLIDAEDFSNMKSNALLVNTSRGPLINETALLQCLQEGRIGGAALDVFDIEPLPVDSPWRTTKWGVDGRSKVVLSPHMGYVEEDVMSRWYDEAVENVDLWLSGKEVKNKMA